MSDSEEQIQQKVTKTFKKNVLQWIQIDDNIRELRAKTKELTNEKKQFEDLILKFLEDVDEKSIEIKDGKLTRNVSKTQAPFKKDNIYKALNEITGDSNKAMQMTEHIIKSRPTVERVNLKRTRKRNNK